MYNEEVPYRIEDIDSLSAEEKRKNWGIAFGLQVVDGLSPSKYMMELAEENIRGDKTYAEVAEEITSHYRGERGKIKGGAKLGAVEPQTLEQQAAEPLAAGTQAAGQWTVEPDKMEPDLVSLRIDKILSEKAFSYGPAALKSIHEELFTGVFDEAEEVFSGFFTKIYAGQYREHNIEKDERVLGGGSVAYERANLIEIAMHDAFKEEESYNYSDKTPEQKAHHVMGFISRLWKIHPFGEGNTRVCATFAVQYLRVLGFEIDNRPFRDNSQFFRDALVMDNYLAARNSEYLRMFTENLLLGGKHDLSIPVPAFGF